MPVQSWWIRDIWGWGPTKAQVYTGADFHVCTFPIVFSRVEAVRRSSVFASFWVGCPGLLAELGGPSRRGESAPDMKENVSTSLTAKANLWGGVTPTDHVVRNLVLKSVFVCFTVFWETMSDAPCRGRRSERGGSDQDNKKPYGNLTLAYLLTANASLHAGSLPKGPGYLSAHVHRIRGAPLQKHRAALAWGLLGAGL